MLESITSLFTFINNNKNWLFDGALIGLLPILISLLRFLIRRKKRINLNIDPKEENVSFYPDPRLRINRPANKTGTQYYILFNVSMLEPSNIHATKVVFNLYQDKKIPCIGTLYETFNKGKDFVVRIANDTIYASGEGILDWSVWILKKNQIENVTILYGSMVYHGFKQNIIGAASLVLIKVEKEAFYAFQPAYVRQETFKKRLPLMWKIINERQSKIIANFYDLAQYNFFAIYNEVIKDMGSTGETEI